MKENQPIPCDILVLSTSNDGNCYVETTELDGEPNFKIKLALSDT